LITTEVMDDLFIDTAPEFLLEPRRSAEPSRFQQLLCTIQSDETNPPDVPNEYETPEWEEDFEFKSAALRDAFQQTVPEELYIELFGSLESKCHLLLDKERKATPKSFYELERYTQGHGDVFLYNQEFKYRDVDPLAGRVIWYPKTYDALIGFRCFVVDIDEVDAGNIRSVIEMITTAPILPNFVNLTGNGLHLYFLFDALHNMKYSAWLMAYDNGTRIETERDVYVTIKQGMIAWFNGSTAGSDVRNHLAQPSRLAGSKTKNRNKRTILYKVSDTKYSIQHIAELVGVGLPDKERIRLWKKQKDAEWRRERKKRQMASVSIPLSLLDFFDRDAPESALEVVHSDTSNDTDTDGDTDGDPVIVKVSRKYQFDYEKFRQQILDDRNHELQWKTEYYAEQNRIRAEKRASVGYQQLKVAQRRGLESQYKQFRQQMFDGAMLGNRADLLHIFWNRALAYQKDTDIIFHDFWELVSHCNVLSRDKITEKQVWKIISGPHCDYSDDSIFNRIGITITMTNKKTEERKQRSEERKSTWKRVLLICESELESNPKLSDRQLTKIVNSYGIKVCHKTISTRFEIKELRVKLRMQ
jgi:hypothetical protein